MPRRSGAPSLTRFGRAPDLGGLEFLEARYQQQRFSKHFHETYSIGLVEEGANGFLLRGRTEIASPGTICVVNPGEVHTGGEHGSWSYRNFYPSSDLLRDVASQVAEQRHDLPIFRVGVIDDPEAAILMRRLFASLTLSAARVERESRLLDLLGHLVRYHTDATLPGRPVRPERAAVALVCDYLEAHLAENVSMTTLAALADISPFHLLRVFRKSTGLPPHAYLVQLRLRRARALVLGGLPLAQVAVETGFSDQAHLTRGFKRAFGVTPGSVRAASSFFQ